MTLLKRAVSSRAGFGLIELLISVFILAIIVPAIATLLVTSHSNIFFVGRKSQALYTAQEQVEVMILDGTDEEEPFAITMPDGSPLNVKGEIIEVAIPLENSNDVLYTFIPKK